MCIACVVPHRRGYAVPHTGRPRGRRRGGGVSPRRARQIVKRETVRAARRHARVEVRAELAVWREDIAADRAELDVVYRADMCADYDYGDVFDNHDAYDPDDDSSDNYGDWDYDIDGWHPYDRMRDQWGTYANDYYANGWDTPGVAWDWDGDE